MRSAALQKQVQTLLFAFGFGLYCPAAFAQSDMVLLKAESGCNFYFPAEWSAAFSEIPDTKRTTRWTGECVGGLTQGMGSVIFERKFQNTTSTTNIILQRHHAGYPMGYGKQTFKSDFYNSEYWLFSYQGKVVAFKGMGLEASEQLLNATTVLMPTQNQSSLKKNDNLATLNRSLQIWGLPCSMYKSRFPDCGFGEGEKKYEVFLLIEQPRTGDHKADYEARKETFCPNPVDITSCIGLANATATAYRADILAFIARSKPGVDDGFSRMNKVLLSAGKASQGSEISPSPNSATPSSVKLAPGNDSAFVESLNSFSAGQLFSMADDYESKSDLSTARAILRKLIERFPGHALAALAAKQLVTMQDK
jgi:hypothetical protein